MSVPGSSSRLGLSPFRSWMSPVRARSPALSEPAESRGFDGHTRAMCEGRLTLRDGRTLAWHECGPVDGRPHLRFQGTPGSRYSRHPHEDSSTGTRCA